MKNKILIISYFIFCAISSSAESIVIKRAGENDPKEICQNEEYNYNATLSDLQQNIYYEVDWIPTTGSTVSSGLNTAKIKWTATTSSNSGTLIAKLYKNINGVRTLLATSNEISVTIKSILHLEPQYLYPYSVE